MSQDDLRAVARLRLDTGELPLMDRVTLLGAAGCGARCMLCGVPITERQIEYEVQGCRERHAPWLRFHIACHDAWWEACEELWGRRSG